MDDAREAAAGPAGGANRFWWNARGAVRAGRYTVRLTKNGKTYETKFTVGLDRRAKFTDADKKAQFDAALKVRGLFDDESALMDRIVFLRMEVAKMAKAVPETDPLHKTVKDFDGKIEVVRKKIVATTEGGAITGEERIREHTDQLYGALLSYEGKPGDYHLTYIDTLRRELDDVNKDFEQILAKDLPALNQAIKGKGEIKPPPVKVAVNEEKPVSGGSLMGSHDPDEAVDAVQFPANFRLSH